jgi:putative N-acetyltransferase (TIGR04045 family)
MIIEPFAPYRASEFQVKFATSDWERQEAHALRRAVFCEEQQIFEADDRDQIDDHAIPIVALSMMGVAADNLVGTVRIHQAEPLVGLAAGSP